MARMSREAQLHAEWIGMAQPDDLVVAGPVLEDAAAYTRRPLEDQQAFRELAPDDRLPGLDALINGELYRTRQLPGRLFSAAKQQ